MMVAGALSGCCSAAVKIAQDAPRVDGLAGQSAGDEYGETELASALVALDEKPDKDPRRPQRC